MKKISLLFAALLICLNGFSQDVIRSGETWPDSDGNHINAHGGGIIKYKGTWYWFGESITGEWKAVGNPCRGSDEENSITFGSQSTFILPLNPKKNIFVYLGDRWNPQNLDDSRHIWLPV